LFGHRHKFAIVCGNGHQDAIAARIHARDADADIALILQQERHAGGDFSFLLHCFSSTRALAETTIAMGGYVSFSGILTFLRSNELREITRDPPTEHLLIDTDAPYVAPVPFRGKRNEPSHIAHTHDSCTTSRDTTTRSVCPTGLVFVPPRFDSSTVEEAKTSDSISRAILNTRLSLAFARRSNCFEARSTVRVQRGSMGNQRLLRQWLHLSRSVHMI
jgi:hypothetical protein